MAVWNYFSLHTQLPKNSVTIRSCKHNLWYKKTFITWCFTNWTRFRRTFNVKEFQICSHEYTIFCRSTIWFSSFPRCILWGKRKDFFITIKLKYSFTCCIRNTNPIFVLWDLLCFWVYLIDYFNTVWFPKFSIILDTIFFCFNFSSLNSIKKVTCTSNRCIVRIINGAFCTLKQECLILIKYIQKRMVSTKTICGNTEYSIFLL